MLNKSALPKLDSFKKGASTRLKCSSSVGEVCSPHTKKTVNAEAQVQDRGPIKYHYLVTQVKKHLTALFLHGNIFWEMACSASMDCADKLPGFEFYP